MNKELESKLQRLAFDAIMNDNFDQALEISEMLLERELGQNPQNTELWLKFAMLEFNIPKDHVKMRECLNKVFEYDPYNAKAVLIMAFAEDLYLGRMSEETFNRLLHVQGENNDIMGMVELAKAWFFYKRDDYLYEVHLKKSIEYAPHFLENYFALGKFYFFKRGRDIGKSFIQKGLDNLVGIYDDTVSLKNDFTDLEDFFNQYYKKTHLSKTNVNTVREWLTAERPSEVIFSFRQVNGRLVPEEPEETF